MPARSVRFAPLHDVVLRTSVVTLIDRTPDAPLKASLSKAQPELDLPFCRSSIANSACCGIFIPTSFRTLQNELTFQA